MERVGAIYYAKGFTDLKAAKDSLEVLASNCDSCYFHFYSSAIWLAYKAQEFGEFSIQKEATDDMWKSFPHVIFKDSTEQLEYYLDLNQRTGNYYKNIDALNTAQHYYKSINDTLITKKSYSESAFQILHNSFVSQGILESRKSNYNKAIKYYNYAVDLENDFALKNNRKASNSNIYCMLGKMYKNKNELKKANSYFEKCATAHLDFINTSPKEKVDVYAQFFIRDLINSFDVSLGLMDFEKAWVYLEAINKIKKPNNVENTLLYLSFSKYYNKLSDFGKRDEYLLKTKQLLSRNPKSIKNNIAYVLQSVQFLIEENKYSEGLSLLTTELFESAIDYPGLLSQLTVKKIHLLYLADNKQACIDEISKFKKFMKNRLSEDIIIEDHIVVLNDYYPTIEMGLDLIESNFPDSVSLAYDLIENIKSIKLFKEYIFSSTQNISDSLLLKYKVLAKEIHKMELVDETKDSISSTRKSLFEAKRERDLLFKKIKKEKGENVFNIPNSSLEEYQKHLKNNEKHLNYFAGENYYYCLEIRSKNVALVRKNKFVIDKDVEKIKNLINHPSNLDSLMMYANALYKDLGMDNYLNNENLIVSTDGKLAQVPFGALVDNDGMFCIEKLNIHYTPSAKMNLYSMTNLNVSDDLKAGIYLPSFAKNALPLKFAQDETNQIEQITNGTIYKGKNVSKAIFIRSASKYNILHLATHAQSVKDDQSLSYISFGDQHESKLYFNEINSVNLNAELVCLSACQTGDGKLFNGEGVQSLARNFLSNGCNATVSTLWNVPDQTISEIMIGFYKHMYKAESKTHALSQSKRDYLDIHIGKSRHPYYWAGTILTGSSAAIVEEQKYYWLAFVALLLFSLSLYLRKRQKL